jgi:hypothetical protein
MAWRRFVRTALVTGALVLPAHAQLESQALLPLAPQFGDAFGEALSRDGEWLAVGSPGVDGDFATGPDVGAVELFERSAGSWQFRQRLEPSQAVQRMRFGAQLALQGPWLFVGAPGAGGAVDDAGEVHVYRLANGAWSPAQVLAAQAPVADAEFGAFLDADAGWLAVGAPRAAAPTGEAATGEVDLFELQGELWVPRQRLSAPQPQFQALFSRVALEGQRLIVGSPLDDEAALNAGAVDVFERSGSTWTHVQRLLAAEAAVQEELGSDVALDGDRLAAGCPGRDSGRGALRVFRDDGAGFAEEALLTVNDGGFGDVLGLRLDLEGARLVASANASEQDPAGQAVYLFQRFGTAWVQASKFESQDPAAAQGYGRALDLDGSELWVGAPGADTQVNNAGRAALVELGQALSPFQALTSSVSLSAGGEQQLRLNASYLQAQKLFLILGTAGGTSPGQFGAGVQVPLNPSPYFTTTLFAPASSPVSPSLGWLGNAGTALAEVVVPAGSDSTLAGKTIHHAYLVLDPSNAQVLSVSTPLALELAP